MKMMFDNGLRKETLPAQVERLSVPHELRLLWAGKLSRWKGLDLALGAMKGMRERGANVHLTVAGDGPLRSGFEASVKRAGLEDVVAFRGRVPWHEMAKEFTRADVFLFTSLRDSSGSVVLEAASYGLPCITLDLGGVGTFVSTSAAIKIKPTTLAETVGAIRDAIVRLRDDVLLRQSMGVAARRFSESMLWEAQAATMWEIYQNTAHA